MTDIINLDEYIRARVYSEEEAQSYVVNAINNLQLVTVVNELPTNDIRNNQIYMVLNEENSNENNRYDLYIYANNDWEQIDTVEFNIDDYYNSATIDNKLSLKSDTTHGHSNATSNTDGFMTYLDKRKLDGIDDEANKIVFDSTPTSNSGNAVTSGGLYTELNKKAVKNHASTSTSYGVSTTTKYGHSMASNTVPLMDSGDGSIGDSVGVYARADHIHPTDTSRASTSSATTSSAGLMSASDKTKLNSIDLSQYYTSNQVDSLVNSIVLGEVNIVIDDTLTSNSSNPVKSSGIKSYVDTRVDDITLTYPNLLDDVNRLVKSMDWVEYDTGTSTLPNSTWKGDTTNLTRGQDYLTLTEDTIGTTTNVYLNLGNEIIVELELYQVDGTTEDPILCFASNNNGTRGTAKLSHCDGSINTWVKIRVDLTPTQAIITNLDTRKKSTVSISNTDVMRFKLWTLGDVTTIRFRNFVAYTI